MDLGFTVTADMAEKDDVMFKKGQQTKSMGVRHNGHIAPEIQGKLYDLAAERFRAGKHYNMNMAITAVFAEFWNQWRETE
jgi:hypothetical protein